MRLRMVKFLREKLADLEHKSLHNSIAGEDLK